MAKLLIALLLSLSLPTLGQQPLTVYSRVPESELDQRNSYEYALITLLLSATEKTHGPFQLLP